ncbi:hypothetical protein EDD22DRAFT_928312 [Suillus occidentalis]|nr:hypothetical protein EDD22DRAFT_928312 [Suillus occidentalis]
MSFARRSQSPPPPMPSPELLPTPLPSPPPIHRSSRLDRSPLLQNTLNASRSYDRLDRKAKEGLFGEDDDFGARKRALGRRSNSSISSLPISPSRSTRRNLGQSSARFRSPPPSPSIASPPPPVPPIPAFMLTPTDKKSVVRALPTKRATAPAHHAIFDLTPSLSRTRCKSSPQAPGAMTCMQFFTMHNAPRRDCRV